MSAQGLWAGDALWSGQAVVERLRQAATGLRLVMTADEIDLTQTVPKQLPAAVVMLDGMRVTGGNGRPAANVELDWLVVIAVRPALPAPDRATQAWGPIMPQVISALQGYVPPGQSFPFAWRTGPRPSYGRDANLLPLLFTLRTVTST